MSTEARGEIFILTISDSRGRGAADYIAEALPDEADNVTITECSKGGANLSELFTKTRRLTRSFNNTHPTEKIAVLLQGGICSLTSKKKGEIFYEPAENNLTKIKDTFREIYEYCTERGYYLAIVSILPVSLDNANKRSDDKRRHADKPNRKLAITPRCQQQQRLTKDIQELNSYLSTLLGDTNTVFININKCFERRTIKKCGKNKKARKKIRFNFKHMTDGIHLNQQDITPAIQKISKGLTHLLGLTATEPEEEQESQESQTTQSEDEGPWDFKRRKTI